MIVGDDDQSIYGWRGAQVENIQRFLNDFPGAETIRLEQNYRSTSNILSAANALIENNNGRLGKKLWTDGADGEPISSIALLTNSMKRVLSLTASKPGRTTVGRSPSAPFSTAATPSRGCSKRRYCRPVCRTVFTAGCASSNAEIKDALSYLRLIANRNDDAAFERVVNTPTRGIGDRTLDVVRQTSRDRQLTLWQACRELLQEKPSPDVLPAPYSGLWN